jgi:class 3 adenylate cyclase
MGNGDAIIRGKSDPGATHMPDERESSGVLERKLSTILSADVAGFSRLMGEDEEHTLKTFRGHKKVFESLVAMHRGRIFNTAGDAILAEFASAVEAVRCATDIQAALRTRNDQLAPSRQVKFRIGINLGDVMVQGQDLMGDGVNVAARLQTAAEPGGICISGSVHDQVRNKLSLSFQSLGEQNFKNIQQPVRTFSILEAESHIALPTPKAARMGSGSAKWIVAGGLLSLLLTGGVYWAHTVMERSKAEHARAIAAAAPAVLPAPEPAKPSVEKPGTEQPVRTAKAARPASEPGAGVAEARRASISHGPAQRSAGAAAMPPAVSAGPYDGVYSGQICYGKTLDEPARCYRAEGTVHGYKITGQWVVMPKAGISMFLAGDVGRSGDVTIGMHSEKPDGTLLVVIDLKGTIHDGTIKANGSFRKGRTATLDWHKNPIASQ